MSTNYRLRLLLLCTVVALSGCSQLLPKKIAWPWDKDQPGEPSKVVAMWTDTVLYQPNETPKRGFGGRLMFYGDKKTEPIKVEGSLVIYAYEENAQEPNKVKPDRKYIITKEQFAAHYSKSKLGHSYSVWLPWDQANGSQKTISLIVRFVPEKGDVVVSEQSKHILPGAETEVAAAGAAPQQGAAASPNAAAQVPPPGGNVQAASYVQPAAGQPGTADPTSTDKRRMNTTTIPLPARLNRPASVGTAAPAVWQQQQQQLTPMYGNAQSGAVMAGVAAMPPGNVPTMNQPTAFQTPGQQNPAWREPVPAWQATPQSRFSPAKPRALGEPISQLPRDRAQSQPYPAGWPSRPASPPSPGSWPATNGSAPTAG
jgi:hypothetical protein